MEANNGNENNNINIHDTDVNTSSWIYVERYSMNESINNERIEELNEDNIRDSDSGSSISIISETEDQEYQDESCTCTTNTIEKYDKVIEKENINTCNNAQDCCTDMKIISRNSETKRSSVFVTIIFGICFIATYFLWPKSVDVQDHTNDRVYSEDDYLETDIVQLDFLNDMYDKEIWNYYGDTNNTCSYLNLFDNEFEIDFDQSMHQSYNSIKKDILEPHKIEINLPQENKGHNEHISDKHLKDKPRNKKNERKNRNHGTFKSKEYYLDTKDKYLIKKEKYLKKLEKEIYKLESKLRQAYRHAEKYISNSKIYKEKKVKINSKQLYENNTAEWYHKIFSARSELRYKEKLSDWLFERSKMRSQLRGQDIWYSSRAKAREEFRSSNKFRSKKYQMDKRIT